MRLRARLILAGVLTAGACAAGWVSAQQASAPSNASPVISPPPKTAPPAQQPAAEEAPPPESALKGSLGPPPPPTVASDVQPDEGGPPSSAAAKAAAVKPDEPLKRPRYAVAVLQAMDKVTAETMRFEVPINKPIRYKSLVFLVRACETTASDEAAPDAIAHVEIDSAPVAQQGAANAPARQVFRGWMFASSPGLNLFQSPAYDAWLIACKTAAPAA